MLALKSLILLLTLLQGIRCFCIYNQLTDGTSIKVHQDITGIPMTETFSQYLEPNAKACCHYTKKNCSPDQNDSATVNFFINIRVSENDVYPTFAKCTSGGTLFIRGTLKYYYAECIDVKGNPKFFFLSNGLR